MNTIPTSRTPDNQQGKNQKSARSLRHALWPVLIGAIVLLAGGAALAPSANLPGSSSTEEYAADWQAVEKLVREHKLEAASALVTEIREIAQEDGHEEPWTRALVEETRLRTALHGYETAVRFLRETPWPSDPLWRAVLELYYAQSLIDYFQQYGYEIRQREHVASDKTADLKAWTRDQIVHEIHLAFQRAWTDREAWGSRSLGPLSKYIEQNNFPARIRGTLRDAVTYLWVNLLADAALWRPEHDNEIFLLDRSALILGDSDGEVDPADPEIHPLRRIGVLLDDLERWHLDHERAEAALETRLSRLSMLFAAFKHDPDKQAVIDHLVTVLDTFDDDFDWWSMGQWQLADFLQHGPGEHRIMAAHRAAVAGRDRHPDSIGGKRCAYLAVVLETPSYQLQAMSIDAAHQRSIQITHRNIDQLHCRAWRLDLADRIENMAHYPTPWPEELEIQTWIHDREPDLAWSVDLPPTPDLEMHQTYTTLPADRKGAYVVAMSVRHDFRNDLNLINAVNIIVSDLVLVTRNLGEDGEINTVSGVTGAALAGVTIDIHQTRSGETTRIQTIESDEHGLAYITLPERRAWNFIFARHGDDVALSEGLYTNRRHEPRQATRSFVYTDRSVYRPGQTLHWKVVAYRGGGSEPEYATLPETDLVVSLVDANHREVTADTLQTNSFGSASGSFALPFGRVLGQWSLHCSPSGGTQVTVEEYKRPTFEVTVTDPESPLRLNESATLTGQVDYYFGLPVTEGEVLWRITREPHYPRWWWWRAPSHGTQLVASGRTSLDKDGVFSLTFTPQADERLDATAGVSYSYRLSVDVTGDSGETRSAQRVFRVGFVSVAARIESDRGFHHTSGEVELIVKRTNLDGVARSGKGSWSLVVLEQPENAILPAELPVLFPPGDDNPFRTPGDLLNPRWQADCQVERLLANWPDGDRIDGGTLEHGDDGAGRIELTGLDAGVYRLHYETEDDFGATCRAQHDFVVAGRQSTPLAVPLVLLAEHTVVAVGDTVRLFAHSGLPGQEMVLELMHGGRRLRRQLLLSGRDPAL
ncbi:MAG: MG2 domain-containing protein, partial [bacterium]